MPDDNDLNDPEDAYDVTDPPRERLRNFINRLDWLREHLPLDISQRGRFERLREDLVALRDETED
jgi:hypothetical protein